jgi:hypothetical protein
VHLYGQTAIVLFEIYEFSCSMNSRFQDVLSLPKPPYEGGLVKESKMEFRARSLSPQESRVVLALSERGLRGVAREEIIELLGATLYSFSATSVGSSSPQSPIA